MKTWRWTLLLVSAGAMAFACSVETTGDDDSTTTTTTSSAGGSTSSVAASTVSTVASTTGGNTCAMQPDFLACANCYCMQDQAGCQAYIAAIDDNLFCGQTCGAASAGMECETFCMDTTMMPDMPCEMCVDTKIDCANPATPEATADCDAALAQCQGDAGCNAFLMQLGTCPQG